MEKKFDQTLLQAIHNYFMNSNPPAPTVLDVAEKFHMSIKDTYKALKEIDGRVKS
jgi:hypothetical protein